jgi:hypothetical protein
MPQINPAIPRPTVDSNAVADPEVTSALVQIIQALNALDATNLVDGAVSVTKLATDAVETSKVKDGNVTKGKLATDALNAFLKLVVPADVKVAFGVTATGVFGGNSTKVGSFGHGMGATPSVVLFTAGPIDTYASTTVPVGVAVVGASSTNITFMARVSDGNLTNNSTPLYWLAIA